MSAQVAQCDRLVCTYRGAAMILGVFVFLVLGSGTGYVAMLALSGQVRDSTTGQPMTPLFGVVFGLAAAACLFLFVWATLCLANESITLDGETILWRDKFAHSRVKCTIHDVLPLSFSARQRFSGSDARVSVMIYRLTTRMGTIKFDSNISDSSALVARFEAISNGQLGPAHPDSVHSHWTNDPLSEASPGDIPIQ
ncbi:MAG: hypothetical protein ACYC96_04755 [Fimbriimonadaceae bacterium]